MRDVILVDQPARGKASNNQLDPGLREYALGAIRFSDETLIQRLQRRLRFAVLPGKARQAASGPSPANTRLAFLEKPRIRAKRIYWGKTCCGFFGDRLHPQGTF
jgi:hypothetical protein